ncbi:MAG: PHP domain-containing protein [Immundisolibacteraceae bacterium]|nr:PHP domain-containing protein [Immundisolibacteraceae bacterium]
MSDPVYDLHCHSTCSDGRLSPTDLVNRAAQKGVTHLALTDHDTVMGVDEARIAAQASNLNLITGVEISVTWENKPLHMIGLNFDTSHSSISQLMNSQDLLRQERSQRIAHKLEKKGVKEPLAAALANANGGMISRPHFAQCLIDQGYAKDFESAFRGYLGAGKPAYVATQWVSMETAIENLTAAGGVAVIAHPRRYRLSHSWMRRLLEEFKAMGGVGVEVITGGGNQGDRDSMSLLAERYQLLGSVGSDFHTAENSWVELGRLKPLPASVEPIWSCFTA